MIVVVRSASWPCWYPPARSAASSPQRSCDGSRCSSSFGKRVEHRLARRSTPRAADAPSARSASVSLSLRRTNSWLDQLRGRCDASGCGRRTAVLNVPSPSPSTGTSACAQRLQVLGVAADGVELVVEAGLGQHVAVDLGGVRRGRLAGGQSGERQRGRRRPRRRSELEAFTVLTEPTGASSSRRNQVVEQREQERRRVLFRADGNHELSQVSLVNGLRVQALQPNLFAGWEVDGTDAGHAAGDGELADAARRAARRGADRWSSSDSAGGGGGP